MNLLIKNILFFTGIVFAIFMALFGLVGLNIGTIETNAYGKDLMYSITFGLLCLTIASIVGLLSIKLYYHR